MIISELTWISISNQGSYYKSLGYGNLKQGDFICISVKDLPKNSNIKIKYKCDECHLTDYREFQLLCRNENHYCFDCSRTNIGKTMNRTNIDIATKNRKGDKHPNWNPNKSAYKAYAYKVRILTEKNYSKNIDKLNSSGLKRTLCGKEGGYQLDHIISIKRGFSENIPVEEIARMENLQLIPWQENRKKWA